jgi:hypothetical protein
MGGKDGQNSEEDADAAVHTDSDSGTPSCTEYRARETVGETGRDRGQRGEAVGACRRCHLKSRCKLLSLRKMLSRRFLPHLPSVSYLLA